MQQVGEENKGELEALKSCLDILHGGGNECFDRITAKELHWYKDCEKIVQSDLIIRTLAVMALNLCSSILEYPEYTYHFATQREPRCCSSLHQISSKAHLAWAQMTLL